MKVCLFVLALLFAFNFIWQHSFQLAHLAHTNRSFVAIFFSSGAGEGIEYYFPLLSFRLGKRPSPRAGRGPHLWCRQRHQPLGWLQICRRPVAPHVQCSAGCLH